MNDQPPHAIARPSRWPWLVLGIGIAWTILIRVPLVLNAEDHLDSDLAVDGLTLLDAVQGQWRWHYPGTPHMGILPVLASLPQALLWGAGPVALVSGGTVMWVLIVASTFWLAARVYNIQTAACAILPLVCSSLGTIWLSGRITGGHLLTLVWHVVALIGLYACLSRGGLLRAVALGSWCGLGLYLDAMFVFTIAGLVAAAIIAWLARTRSPRAVGQAAVFVLALFFGLAPREIGRRIDPYDAYPSQFEATTDRRAVLDHSALLAFHCLPRLIAGLELPQIEKACLPTSMPVRSSLASSRLARLELPGPGEWLSVALLLGFALALFRLARDVLAGGDPARSAVASSSLLSAVLIVGAFLVNRNIYNSDNYRYLIYLLVPWSLGFGRLMADLLGRRPVSKAVACLAMAALFVAMTTSVVFWYRDERGYIDRFWMPAKAPVPAWSDLVVLETDTSLGKSKKGRFTVPPDVSHVFGGYWEVYRMAFLSGGRITAIPFAMFPNRFPGWSRGLGPEEGRLLIVLPEREARPGMPSASKRPRVIRSARKTDWHPAFNTAWANDGRDLAELGRLRVVVP
jgi:hypothetical protein